MFLQLEKSIELTLKYVLHISLFMLHRLFVRCGCFHQKGRCIYLFLYAREKTLSKCLWIKNRALHLHRRKCDIVCSEIIKIDIENEKDFVYAFGGDGSFLIL